MPSHQHAFTAGEIGLVMEALLRAAKRQESEAKWFYTRGNEKQGEEHSKKSTEMYKIIKKLAPVKGLQSI